MARKKQLIVDTVTLADFYSVSIMTISRWTKAGAPKLTKNTYDLAEFNSWWLDTIYSGQPGSCDDDDLKASRALYWRAKAEGETLKTQTVRGEVHSMLDCEKYWTSIILPIFAVIDQLSNRLPPLLENKTRQQIHEIINEEIQQLRDGLTRSDTRYPPITDIKQKPIKNGKPTKETEK